MTLSDSVVLEIDSIEGSDGPAAFRFRTDLETTRELTRRFVLGDSGQFVKAAADILPGNIVESVTGVDFEPREGYHLDGGAGEHTFTVTATRGAEEDLEWGDGSAGGESTKYDAAPGDLGGAEDVLDYWLNQSKSDSGGQMKLHVNHHTDGSYSDEAGVYGEPVTVVVTDHSISTDDRRGHSEIEVSLTMRRTATIPDVQGVVDGVIDDVQGAIDDALDTAGDFVFDW